jgi:pyruvate dehydrogenase E1 component beta subunit
MKKASTTKRQSERILSYAEAVREGTEQEMARDSAVILLGQGVDYDRGLLGTTRGLVQRFGPSRVFDTPLAEDGMTGISIGAAMSGLRPIHTHVRMDFLTLCMNQLVNIAAKAHYMFGGSVKVPLVIRTLIGDGWGAQHSQGLHSQFANIPGLKIVAPSTPHDAKGCLAEAVRDDNPVIFIEHFKLYAEQGNVPAQPYTIPFGKSVIRRKGKDITLVGISYANVECLKAAAYLETAGISAEVIDPVSLAPLDMKTILASVEKTGRLLVVDTAWTGCGLSAEIVAVTAEHFGDRRKLALQRLGFAPVPSPNAPALEKHFYPDAEKIAQTAAKMVAGNKARMKLRRRKKDPKTGMVDKV